MLLLKAQSQVTWVLVSLMICTEPEGFRMCGSGEEDVEETGGPAKRRIAQLGKEGLQRQHRASVAHALS